jgi:hypothetical protein
VEDIGKEVDQQLDSWVKNQDDIDRRLDEAVREFIKKLDGIGADHPRWSDNKPLVMVVRRKILSKLNVREMA